MGPVEDWDAVVVDEMQQPAELMVQLGNEHLRNTNDGVEWWVKELENLLKNFIITCQSVFQLHLPTHAHRHTDRLIDYFHVSFDNVG